MKRNLPEKYRKIYREFYLSYSNSKSIFRRLSLIMERWYHFMAYEAYTSPKSILELGAGNLNHLQFEKNFINYDVVEPKEYLLNSANEKSKLSIRNKYSCIKQIPSANTYDKIIAIAVLEHVLDLRNVLFELKKHLKSDGKLIIEIPAEGEFLWWLGWRLTTGIGFWLKYKLDYGIIMRFEHVNNAEKVFSELRKYFYIEEVKSFPFNLRNARFYIHIVCRKS